MVVVCYKIYLNDSPVWTNWLHGDEYRKSGQLGSEWTPEVQNPTWEFPREFRLPGSEHTEESIKNTNNSTSIKKNTRKINFETGEEKSPDTVP
jgi:hypothetical protein